MRADIGRYLRLDYGKAMLVSSFLELQRLLRMAIWMRHIYGLRGLQRQLMSWQSPSEIDESRSLSNTTKR